MESKLEELMTINQVADYLQITRAHVYNLINKYNLPVLHISKQAPRIKKSELINWINKRDKGVINDE